MLLAYSTTDLSLLILLMSNRISMLEATEGVELRCIWLKRTTEKQVGRQKRGEIHVHCCSRGGHIVCIMMTCLPVSSSVD